VLDCGTERDPQVASASMTWANWTGHTGSGGRAIGTDDGGSWQRADGSWDGNRQMAVGADDDE
jgi:hypothetical protein